MLLDYCCIDLKPVPWMVVKILESVTTVCLWAVGFSTLFGTELESKKISRLKGVTLGIAWVYVLDH